MHTNGKRTTSVDLSAIIEGLIKADVKFILVGGLAAVVQGAPVTTMDVDIVHNRSSENISKLFTFLKSIDAIYRRPDNKIIKPKEKDFAEMGHAFFSTRIGPLDVLAFIEEGKTYEDLFKHTVEIEFRGHTLRVLDIKMLIELKRTSKDSKDKQRLPVLEETLRQLEKELFIDSDVNQNNKTAE
ncbi:hypothetical protein BuS5_02326 [Desulfosarcina sp. BuS5]|uniref:hypothetical protein n=1 Tax=Desulfosarcina sp. BuS5 TaxID=933262 RepID=UPI00047FD772|nr:hypothetical protein [Desulfosarcina sp. BuS5]WDN89358.1 hypothetical protein BuS5_02326 [Desulfosarcina sp. BuS5]